MGRARRNRRNNRNENRNENRIESTGSNNRTDNRTDNRTESKPIDDCFALYILFKKLHMLFIYQAYSILYNERFIQDGNLREINPNEINSIYSIIQINRTSKYYPIYRYFV